MSQKIAPFIEGKYGWNFGESGWNDGMDENLLKFSFLFDKNVDEIVTTLPSTPTNGKSYFNTTDNRLYFVVSSAYYSTPTPKWFVFYEKLSGKGWQYNGTSIQEFASAEGLDTRLDSVELTVSQLGTAAFQDATDFATPLDISDAEVRANEYTDNFTAELATSSGASLIGYNGVTVATQLTNLAAGGGAGILFGLSLANNVVNPSTHLDILSGVCRDISNVDTINLNATIVKRIDAVWAAGSGNGGLDTGVVAADTGYHVWLIKNTITAAVDVLFSTSATNPLMPAGYTSKRRIGAILTTTGGAISSFVQQGGWFMLKTPLILTTSWGNFSGGTPILKSAGVPLGVKLMPRISVASTSTTAGYVSVTDPDRGAIPTSQNAIYYQQASQIHGVVAEEWTNTSGQLYVSHSGTAAPTTNIFLQGWYDTRDTSV